tara:strand:+ start:9301 stop:10251 length:951 start_codon:yes stop_codon:yes gene_type:complete
MHLIDALAILEMSNISVAEITPELVTRHYRKVALKKHPDKNGNSEESKKEFQELAEAYELVIKVVADKNSEEYFSPEETMGSGSYFDILKEFIKSSIDGNYNENVFSKIKQLIDNYQDVSVGFFENMDRDTAVSIYQFLATYSSVLYLKEDLLDKVKRVIQAKFEELLIYTIEPNLEHILGDKVYHLSVPGENDSDPTTYLVPLWHREIYYENAVSSGKEILVLCNPNLPENYSIDDSNNLTFVKDVSLSTALFNPDNVLNIEVCPGVNMTCELDKLSLKRVQAVKMREPGILKINEKSILDDSSRGSVTALIRFV